ncbi:hypothetical protein FHT76_001370 [Rhizobium sp. BK176]|nr:hypothetical protein [Rhizobium sp. BK176]
MKDPLAAFCVANRIAGIKAVIKAIDDRANLITQRREPPAALGDRGIWQRKFENSWTVSDHATRQVQQPKLVR